MGLTDAKRAIVVKQELLSEDEVIPNHSFPHHDDKVIPDGFIKKEYSEDRGSPAGGMATGIQAPSHSRPAGEFQTMKATAGRMGATSASAMAPTMSTQELKAMAAKLSTQATTVEPTRTATSRMMTTTTAKTSIQTITARPARENSFSRAARASGDDSECSCSESDEDSIPTPDLFDHTKIANVETFMKYGHRLAASRSVLGTRKTQNSGNF